MQRESERAEAVASYVGAGPVETKERRARATRMTRPPACLMRNVRGGDRTRPQGGGCHKACDWRAVRPCGAYGVRQHAPGRGAEREVLKFVNAGVLKLVALVLLVVGV